MHGIRYRSDIDGLRTIAVVPVVLYHFGVPFLGGGYVGVDVFFVISGFLITAAILKEIEGGSFSVLGFYERRIRRIFPALFAMIAATLVVGWFLFMPDEFKDLGASAVGAALFSSNILFWQQSDYFAGPVELKPLIHTWSLAVEEQYYILFPYMLVAIARWGRGRYVPWTAGVAVVSLALSIWGVVAAPTATFYLLPTRAWELLVGSLLAQGAMPALGRRQAEGAALVGIAAIIGSALLLSDATRFPGANALWPCVGAALILHAGTHHTTLVGRALGWRPMVFLGLISYSLYLWHWPLIVFARYAALRDLRAVETVALLGVTLLLAILSWRFIERPFRARQRIGRTAILTGGAVAMAVTIAVGAFLFRTDGLPARFGDMTRFAKVPIAGDPRPGEPVCLMEADWRQWAGKPCFLTPGPGRPVLLWGDSHASHYIDAFRADRSGVPGRVLLYATVGCLPVFGVDAIGRPDCRANNDHVVGVIRRYGIRRVVLSAHWEYLMERNRVGIDSLAATLARLRAMGVEVAIVGDNPDYTFNNPQFLAYRLAGRPDPDAPFYIAPRNDWSVNRSLAALVAPADFYDPMATLCRARRCLVFSKGLTVMADNAHFSQFGATLVEPQMARLFR